MEADMEAANAAGACPSGVPLPPLDHFHLSPFAADLKRSGTKATKEKEKERDHPRDHESPDVAKAVEIGRRAETNLGLELRSDGEVPRFPSRPAKPANTPLALRLVEGVHVHLLPLLASVSPEVCLRVANKYGKATRRMLDGRATAELSQTVDDLLDYLLREATSPEPTARACALAIILSRISAQWTAYNLKFRRSSGASAVKGTTELLTLCRQVYLPLIEHLASMHRSLAIRLLGDLSLLLEAPTFTRKAAAEDPSLDLLIAHLTKLLDTPDSHVHSLALTSMLRLTAARGSLKGVLALLYMLLTEPRFAEASYDATIDIEAVLQTFAPDGFTKMAHVVTRAKAAAAVAFDGQYLYVHHGASPTSELLKVGTGHRGTVLNHVYARSSGVPEVQASSAGVHMAVVDGRLYFRSPQFVEPLCLLVFDADTLQLRDRVHHDGTGSIATEDNRAWGLASYGPIAACGQLLYHIHTTRPAEEQRQQQESSTMDLESAEPSQKQKRAQWLVDVYQTPGMQHYPLFRPAPQNASFKQPFEPTPHPDKANGLGGMFEVITAMPRYQAFSFEELRWEATSHLRAPVDTTQVDEAILADGHFFVEQEGARLVIHLPSPTTSHSVYRCVDLAEGSVVADLMFERASTTRPSLIDYAGWPCLSHPEVVLASPALHKGALRLPRAVLSTFAVLDKLAFDT
ncbi:uncharacterized protein ACA1_048480 [Acanthamoeba castellanii str. Neff]|uniref:Uncharacterized protein n=1 Tax=Acanthamoeba castellanii (strain ATCC 30010 / Neff) TaxID=1257118 RepID=L8GDB8_ACACF|nr:uncharacterized protein ACA1_048480 [Acanthamoeba castellanii str. Neff]ELR11047.1 hypothetical protein ACA1_048480 [Acanthamoeba castellanii str. Neff]